MRTRAFIFVVLAFLLGLTAWSDFVEMRRDTVVITRPIADFPTAKRRLIQAFSGADPRSRKFLTQTLAAFEDQNYQEAAVGLLALTKASSQNFEQWNALRSVYAGFERDIIAATQRGNPDAKEASEILRSMSCCVK